MRPPRPVLPCGHIEFVNSSGSSMSPDGPTVSVTANFCLNRAAWLDRVSDSSDRLAPRCGDHRAGDGAIPLTHETFGLLAVQEVLSS